MGNIVAQVNPTSVRSLNTLHGSPSWAWTEQFFVVVVVVLVSYLDELSLLHILSGNVYNGYFCSPVFLIM